MARYDVLVIGAGPGGYVAAIRAAQLGLSVAVVEKEKLLGGTCLRVGCIPSKALLESSELFHKAKKEFSTHGIEADPTLDLAKMLKRKDGIVRQLTNGVAGLFKKNKIERIEGEAKFTGPGSVSVNGENVEAEHIVIATGSVSAPLAGVDVDGGKVVTSTEALSFEEVPRRLIVIGGGYIGLEMASVWSRLGSEVTVLEYLPRLLPGMDDELAKAAGKILGRQGMEIVTGVKVTGADASGGAVKISGETDDGDKTWEAERVLVAVGRKPATDGLGLDAAGIVADDRGRIDVDGKFRTSVQNVFAIGDVIRGPMLAHKASEEGVAVANLIAGKPGHVNYDAIPGVVYTDPEIASVGRTEQQLADEGVPYNVGRFPFMANGRAKALGYKDGFVKILAHKETDRILGAHAIGPRAGDLIAELVLAKEFKASAEDIALTSHAHPTLAEVIKEAALDVSGEAIHI